MKWVLPACCAMLLGCATVDGGPKVMAETGCMFIFFAGMAPLHSILGAAACTFGVEELKEKKEKIDAGPEGAPG
jgi:hypothetical protein